MKNLTRAERYKRNYALIRNTYQDPALAKHARTWGDKKLYEELGITITKRTPDLKPTKTKKKAYYDRKLANFLYARGHGADVKTAKRLQNYRKEKIDSGIDFSKTKGKKMTNAQRERRMDNWSKWSSGGNYFPPEIEADARKRNKSTNVGGKQLDDYAKFGYVVEFYRYVEGKGYDEILQMVKQDPHDARRVMNNYYRSTARAAT